MPDSGAEGQGWAVGQIFNWGVVPEFVGPFMRCSSCSPGMFSLDPAGHRWNRHVDIAFADDSQVVADDPNGHLEELRLRCLLNEVVVKANTEYELSVWRNIRKRIRNSVLIAVLL